MTKKLGKFIVFEGIDGSGKDYQKNQLSSWLNERGIFTFVTNFPSYSDVGLLAREYLKDEDFMSFIEGTPLEIVYINQLISCDILYETYKPGGIVEMLKEGVWVLCSRYLLSSLAYYDHDKKSVKHLLNCHEFALVPDVNFVLDCPATIALERIEKRDSDSAKSYHESLDKLKVIRSRYLHMANNLKTLGKIKLVNSQQTKHATEMEIKKHMNLEIINNDNDEI